MKKDFFNGVNSKADLEDAIQAFSHLASYFPVYEPCDDGCCRLEKTRTFKVRQGDSVLCGEDGVECIAFIVSYGKRAVCLIEAMMPNYEYDDPMRWTPLVLSQIGYIECIDYNGLYDDFKETAQRYIGEEWMCSVEVE